MEPVKPVGPVKPLGPMEPVEPDEETTLSRRRTPRTPEQMRADRELVAPLFAYLEAHCIVPMWAARRAAMRHGEAMTRSRLFHIKRGAARVPEWFVEGVCREIGQPVEVVMGREWRQRHMGADASSSAAVSSAQVRTQRQAS